MSRTASRPALYTVTSFSALLVAISSAAAQAPSEPDDDVITVTAQKREQTVNEVPFSLDVLRGDELDAIRAGGRDILFLSGRSPSLYAEGSFGRTFPRFYIRGLGNTDFDLNANQPVSLVYDEVVLENSILKGFPVFDLERIEVLRGPQGTLFGRNTPAGVIKFDSAKPTDEFEAYGRITYGRFNLVEAEGAVSGPIVQDTLSARLSVLYERRDDIADNNFTGPTFGDGADGFEEFDEFAGRLQFLFTPTENWTALVNVHGRRLDGGSRLFRANGFAAGEVGLVDTLERGEAAQDAAQFLDVFNFGVSVKTDWDLGWGVLTNIASYDEVGITARGDVDGGFGASFAPPFGPGFIPFPAETADNITDHFQATSETRLAFKPFSGFDATVGFFWFRENLELENLSFDTLAGGSENGRAFQDQETISWAIFASGSWAASDRLTLQGGIRLSDESKNFDAFRVTSPFGAPPLNPPRVELDDTVVTGDFAATYEVNDELSVFARYARGFRAPNVQGRIVFGDVITTADTESVNSFEGGLKGGFFGGRGSYSLTGFYFRTNDQQLTAVGGAGNFNQLLNADAVVGTGFEFDGSLRASENLTLTAGVSLNNTRIDDPDLEVGVCGAPCTVLDPRAANGNALIDGNQLPQSPRWIANLGARYQQPFYNGRVYADTDWAYRSRVNFFLYDSLEFQDTNELNGGVRIGYQDDAGWEFSAFGRNILNDVSASGAVDFNNFTVFINEPPTWGVEAKVTF